MATTQPVQSSQPPSHEQTSGEQELSWEGDRMFNIYIYDYCYKRGFRKTARELLGEAEIPPESQPPINAKQGLLFEWWSVFWVLFTAKSNGTGPDEAMVYTQHQIQQAQAARQQVPVQAQAQQRMQNQAQLTRYVNGAVQRVSGSGGPTAGAAGGQLPNGIGPSAATPTGATGASIGFQMSTSQPNSQSNGVAGPSTQQLSHGTAISGPNSHNPNTNPNLNVAHGLHGQGIPGQRPIGSLGQGQPRAPFQSPTLAHSQNPNASGSTPNPSAGATTSAYPGVPMGQMSMGMGPSPNLAHMTMSRGGMFPPNANGMGGSSSATAGTGGGPMNAAHTPPQPFQSSSRAATPAQGQGGNVGAGHSQNVTHASPSLAARQVQSHTPTNPNFNVNMGAGGANMPRSSFQDQQLNTELSKIDMGLFNHIRSEMGLENKELLSMTADEKNRIIQTARQRTPSGSAAGNQNVNLGLNIMSDDNLPGPVGSSNNQAGRNRAKRNSTSPTDESEMLPKSDSSPPDRKRVRRSPNTATNPNPNEQNTNANSTSGPNPGMSNSSPMHGFPPGASNQGMANGLMRGPGPQINGGFPAPGQPMTPQMSHMSPGMMNHMPAPAPQIMSQQMTQQLQQMQYQKNQQYHQSMQALHKMGAASLAATVPPLGPNEPGFLSSDTPYNSAEGQRQAPPFVGGGLLPPSGPGPVNNNRQGGQNKPIGMMPPPSPLTNGMQKGVIQAGVNKPDGGNTSDPSSSGRMDGSPRTTSHPPPNSGSGTGTAPATPTSGQPGNVTAPSPSQILNNRISSSANNNVNPPRPPTAQNHQSNSTAPPPPPPPVPDPLSTSFDFMQGPFEEFDLTSLSNLREDINFERDFGAWFNPDEVALDLQ